VQTRFAMFQQLNFKTHRLYNRRIAKLLSLGKSVYIVSYVGLDNLPKYRVFVELLPALLSTMGGEYTVNLIKFKLGQTQPKSYWGQVELETMRAIESDRFLQAFNRYFNSRARA
jgi:hypothetical protein